MVTIVFFLAETGASMAFPNHWWFNMHGPRPRWAGLRTSEPMGFKRHGPRSHARPVSEMMLLAFGKPHHLSNLCWAGLQNKGGG